MLGLKTPKPQLSFVLFANCTIKEVGVSGSNRKQWNGELSAVSQVEFGLGVVYGISFRMESSIDHIVFVTNVWQRFGLLGSYFHKAPFSFSGA